MKIRKAMEKVKSLCQEHGVDDIADFDLVFFDTESDADTIKKIEICPKTKKVVLR